MIESLEQRVLLTVLLDPGTGRLEIAGTDGDDRVTVDLLDETTLRVVINDEIHQFARAGLNSIGFQGLAGDDQFTNMTSLPSHARGGGGADTLIGGSGADTLLGQRNSDVLVGGGGADQLRGGSGNDRLDGGDGNDRLFGQAGDDVLSGRAGSDRLNGAIGTDTLVEEADLDLMLAQFRMTGLGTDRVVRIERAQLTGGPSSNRINAVRFAGDATLFGGGGDDTLLTGRGNDVLYGGDGNDSLNGGLDDDQLLGESGRDTLTGGGGQDALYGGTGDDVLLSGDASELQTVHVTSLNPDGPGSLSEALSEGNRRIVFDVAGVIDLRTPSTERPGGTLIIESSNIVIDGESAPSPGISIIGGRVLIRDASDVTIRHIRIRPGQDHDDDALSIVASEDILIQNVSLSWSRDELADVWDNSRNVTFDQVLFAEPLDVSAHAHGLLVGKGADRVTVTRSVFSDIRKRGPKFAFGTELSGTTSGLSVNNIVYNPKSRALIVGNQARIAAIGNLVIPGPDTRSDATLTEVQSGVQPGTALYQLDNFFVDADLVLRSPAGQFSPLFTAPVDFDNPEAFDWALTYRHGINGLLGQRDPSLFDAEVNAPPESWMVDRLATLNVLPSSEVQDSVLATAGAFYWDRDATDARVIAEIQNRTGQIINTEDEVGGLPPFRFVPRAPSWQRIAPVVAGDSLYGGDGNDTLIGDFGNDVINGEAGHDHAGGGSGNDAINGGDGNDWLYGNAGDDVLSGNAGVDRLFGGVGADTALWQVGDGSDSLQGDAGFDSVDIQGTAATDQFFLGVFEQALRVQLGVDSITAQNFEEASIDGGGGDDFISADSLSGFANDYPTVVPSGFSLQLQGGAGNDMIQMGSVTDPFVRVTVRGGEGDDTINLPGTLIADRTRAPLSSNAAFGQGGDDTLTGGSANEYLDGGDGNDHLSASDGQDTLVGGSGDDFLDGGFDDDLLVGADGNDTLVGEGGRDVLVGGDGQDALQGGEDDDILIAAGVRFSGNSLAALADISSQWSSGLSYQSRVSVLTDPGFLYTLDFNESSSRGPSLTDDDRADTLSGGNGADWFLIADTSHAVPDTVLDLLDGEQVTQ